MIATMARFFAWCMTAVVSNRVAVDGSRLQPTGMFKYLHAVEDFRRKLALVAPLGGGAIVAMQSFECASHASRRTA